MKRGADVVVVGSGNAAMSAALAAREEGADVLVLEKAPREWAGGNSYFTAGAFRLTYESLDDIRELIADASEAGPGRGWALFMMLIGVGVAAVVALLRFRSPGLRRLEDDLPDVTPEDRLRQSTGDSMPVGVTESAPGAVRVTEGGA